MKIISTKKFRDFQNMLKLQSIMLCDDYMVGLYNGMETILALLENREQKLYKSDFRNCILNNPNNERVTIIDLSERK